MIDLVQAGPQHASYVSSFSWEDGEHTVGRDRFLPAVPLSNHTPSHLWELRHLPRQEWLRVRVRVNTVWISRKRNSTCCAVRTKKGVTALVPEHPSAPVQVHVPFQLLIPTHSTVRSVWSSRYACSDPNATFVSYAAARRTQLCPGCGKAFVDVRKHLPLCRSSRSPRSPRSPRPPHPDSRAALLLPGEEGEKGWMKRKRDAT